MLMDDTIKFYLTSYLSKYDSKLLLAFLIHQNSMNMYKEHAIHKINDLSTASKHSVLKMKFVNFL